MRERLQYLYYILIRFVPRWIVASAIVALIAVVFGFVVWTAVVTNGITIAALIIGFVVVGSIAALADLLPRDPRKSKHDDEGGE